MAYCKHCGSEVKTEYGKTEFMCPNCGVVSKRNELVNAWTLDARMTQLKAMHTIMCECNEESIYFSWILLMPDAPTVDDFRDIALDEEQYNECFDLFLKLAAKEGMRW